MRNTENVNSLCANYEKKTEKNHNLEGSLYDRKRELKEKRTAQNKKKLTTKKSNDKRRKNYEKSDEEKQHNTTQQLRFI